MIARKAAVGAAALALALVAPLATVSGTAVALESGTRHVSVSNTLPKPLPADLGAESPAISEDGRYVAFVSRATNLDSRAAGTEEIYLRDLQTGTTTTVSANGRELGERASALPSISADGSYVAYVSQARNLGGPTTGVSQAYVWSRATNTTEVVSVTNDISPQAADRPVLRAKISSDGRSIVFTTAATMTGQDTAGVEQVFRRDLETKTTTMVSEDVTRTPAIGGRIPVGNVDISKDGQTVVFDTASQLTAKSTRGNTQVYLRHATDAPSMISVSPTGTVGDGTSESPKISADGTTAAFTTMATNLLASSTSGKLVMVRDLRTASSSVASLNYLGTNIVRGPDDIAISGDGQVVAFVTTDPSTSRINAGLKQVYIRDRAASTTTMASVDTTTVGAGNGPSQSPSLTLHGDFVSFVSLATNIVPGAVADDYRQAFVARARSAPSVERIGGVDRYDAARNISASAFAPFGTTSPPVFMASGENFADALAASAAAGSQEAPVLLLRRDEIPLQTVSELERLTPREIIVVGGRNVISDAVVAGLAPYSRTTVTRIAGTDRYDSSAKLSKTAFSTSGGGIAYVASGETFPDALSGAAAAGRDRAPVLLTLKESLPTSVRQELERLKVSRIVVLGGSASVSDGVLSTLNSIAPTTRISGTDRYDSAAAVSRATFSTTSRTVYVASGETYPDALAGSAAAIRAGGPMLLVTREGIPESTKAELTRIKPAHIVLLGGVNTVSDGVLSALGAYLAS